MKLISIGRGVGTACRLAGFADNGTRVLKSAGTGIKVVGGINVVSKAGRTLKTTDTMRKLTTLEKARRAGVNTVKGIDRVKLGSAMVKAVKEGEEAVDKCEALSRKLQVALLGLETVNAGLDTIDRLKTKQEPVQELVQESEPVYEEQEAKTNDEIVGTLQEILNNPDMSSKEKAYLIAKILEQA